MAAFDYNTSAVADDDDVRGSSRVHCFKIAASRPTFCSLLPPPPPPHHHHLSPSSLVLLMFADGRSCSCACRCSGIGRRRGRGERVCHPHLRHYHHLRCALLGELGDVDQGGRGQGLVVLAKTAPNGLMSPSSSHPPPTSSQKKTPRLWLFGYDADRQPLKVCRWHVVAALSVLRPVSLHPRSP